MENKFFSFGCPECLRNFVRTDERDLQQIVADIERIRNV